MEIITIDGSYGEGGGQILRTAVSLATLQRRQLEVYNIRAKRGNPGLRPQHIAVISTMAKLCNGEVQGLEPGSMRILYKPGVLRGGMIELDMGTAGSITLFLQALVPVISLSGVKLQLSIKGGTDVPWSPTMEYFRQVVLPAYRAVNVHATIEVRKRGYYPRGGGVVDVLVQPSNGARPLYLEKRTDGPAHILSVCSNLPSHIAQRQADACKNVLEGGGVEIGTLVSRVEDAISPGSAITVYSVDKDGPFIGSDALGARGKPAEHVGSEAGEKFLGEWKTGAPVDSHIADMLVVPLSLASGPSKIQVSRLTEHLRTNLYISKLFTNSQYSFQETNQGSAIITINPKIP